MRTTMTQLEGGHVAARRAMSMNGHRKTSEEHVKNATLIPLQVNWMFIEDKYCPMSTIL